VDPEGKAVFEAAKKNDPSCYVKLGEPPISSLKRTTKPTPLARMTIYPPFWARTSAMPGAYGGPISFRQHLRGEPLNHRSVLSLSGIADDFRLRRVERSKRLAAE
jgi:hypothetical protein